MKLDIDFKNIDYLRNGNEKQKKVYDLLIQHKILKILEEFDPILIGTIPINIDIESSDIDLICHFTDSAYFKKYVVKKFEDCEKFKIAEITAQGSKAIIANFFIAGFEIEIFAQNIPTKLQRGYRHMIIEHKLLKERDNDFRARIISLKEKGYKTEPAFAFELGLKGNPYEALLALEK